MTGAPDPTTEFFALQKALAGRYSLERELGRGGMGIVYLAHDVALDRPVALKLLPPAYAAQPTLRERFMQEARIAARLSHPNIVPIHAVDEVGDFVFFVMSFVEGETLGQRVRERGPVPHREASRILREVSWALGYAHAQGVVHRDIKPDNILLEAGSGRALVTDFGIAHVGSSTELTTSEELLGTPEYMSPEQASGDDVDGRSDLYALGVVGHYMLTGELPFKGANAQATLAKQLTQPAPALGEVAPEVPRPLAEAIDRCLVKDPEHRIQGGEELAEALGRVLQNRREVPAAIRLFQEQNQDSTGAIGVVSMLLVLMVAIIYLVVVEGGEPLSDVLPGLIMMVPLMMVPVAMLGVIARRLLKAGYGHDELVRAFRRDVEDRRWELAAQVGEDTALDVWAPRVGWAGLAVFLIGMLGLLVPGVSESVIGALLLAGMPLALGGAVVATIRYSTRKALPGARWLEFWDSLLGRGLFKLAGLGVERGGQAAGGSYRPTEMAIGMAAERIFEELPKGVKKALGDLPAVVKALEDHARRMRARVKELDRVMGEVREREPSGEGGPGGGRINVAGKRDSVTEDLRRARDAAEEGLREVVVALEGLRLELLRLHVGSGNVESLTADLSAARALSENAGLLLEGRREVDEMLGQVAEIPEGDPPVPA